MKNILITGSTDGIGFETAKSLAAEGHHIWLHGRSLEKTRAAEQRLLQVVPRGQFSHFACDLADFAQIRSASADLLRSLSRLDVLINNAGVYLKDFSLSPYGVEMTMTINHLGPFLLTKLLHDALKAAAPSRVINVSSIAHTRGQLRTGKFALNTDFDPYSAYAASKLANVLFTKKLAELWKKDGISVYSLHPGVINTKLLKTGFGAIGAETASGALTSVFLATEEIVPAESGSYFDNCKPRPVSPLAEDAELREQLWQWSEKLTS